MEYSGLPGPEFHNLDKDYRAWRSSSGCVVIGFEPLTQGSNNFAIRFWTSLLGYQRGVYRGIYPDKPSTAKFLEISGKEVEISRSENALTFTFDSRPIQILGTRNWGRPELDSFNLAKVVMVDNELIIIKPMLSSGPEVTYLADTKSGRVFAEYYERDNDTNP